ncbi:MAG TPA: beta-glucosidase BglX [Candidatus Binatia bacterium]|nr:beta-glucosidase BglX [Candidatus Binatia bacterium]
MNTRALKFSGSFMRVAVVVLLLHAGVATLRAQSHPDAKELLRQMTLEEKIAQLSQIPGMKIPEFDEQVGDAKQFVRKYGAGSVLWVSDSKEINQWQHLAVDESRLHIPILFGLDVIHGYHTIFPSPIAMASSWDPSLVEAAQTVAAREARAAGIGWTFAPMVDIARDARWGRMVEGAGEDPYLGAAMARAQVRGFQGSSLGAPDHVLACAKHFAGYGAADGGRDYDSSYIPEEEMWNVYLPPFKAAAAADAGVGSFMSAYMDLNDIPASGNRWLLHDVLRETWGYKGFVVSDANAVHSLITHGYASGGQDAAFKAFSAGLNMDMASGTYIANLASLFKQGRVSMQQIDDAVLTILETKIRLGLFEHPYADESRLQQVLNAPESLELTRKAVQRSVVLLRNEQKLLPLDQNQIRSIAIIGPLADAQLDALDMWGAITKPGPTVDVVQGIKNKVGSGVRVDFAHGPNISRNIPSFFEGTSIMPATEQPAQTAEEARKAIEEAVAAAKRSDVAVLVLGEITLMSGEAASRSSLKLSGGQQELLEAVAATGKPIVLVLINGRPLDISWAAEHVPAILEAWYPGNEAGNGIADVLFGDANPAGHLPVSWPRSSGELPLYYNHNRTHAPEDAADFKSRYWDALSTPLYPFGYGLSYTTFSFDNLKLSQAEAKVGATLDVSVDVTNTGSRAGEAVAQLYIHQRAGSASRPVRQLKGFQRVNLAAGSKQTLHFKLGSEELQFWSPASHKWVVEPEQFDVWVGQDSTAKLHSEFRLNP